MRGGTARRSGLYAVNMIISTKISAVTTEQPHSFAKAIEVCTANSKNDHRACRICGLPFLHPMSPSETPHVQMQPLRNFNNPRPRPHIHHHVQLLQPHHTFVVNANNVLACTRTKHFPVCLKPNVVGKHMRTCP